MLIGDDFAKSEESGGYFWGGDLSERVSEGTVSLIKSRVLDAMNAFLSRKFFQ